MTARSIELDPGKLFAAGATARISYNGRITVADSKMHQQCPTRAMVLTALALALPCLSICSLTSSGDVGNAVLASSAIGSQDSNEPLSTISIDYPEDGSIFPPGVTPPTFLWRDAAGSMWNIDISFAD